MLKRKIKYFIIIMALSASCTNKNSEKTIRKGEFTLIGNFSSDSVPEGTIKFYDSVGNLRSVKNYKNGLLDGESYTYYSNGKSQSSLRFEGNKEMGFKSIFDSLGHLIYKSNFFYGKEIGEVYAFDTFNNVTEYSFNNFEDDILYYSKYDPDTKKYSYPGDSYLIKANTSMVSLNGHDGATVFLYLFRPPKLRLSYSIAYFNQKDSPLTIFPIQQSSFYYQGFFERKTENLKLGVFVNKYDSFSNKEEVIIQYLKTSYP